jgi:hypothetical protein
LGWLLAAQPGAAQTDPDRVERLSLSPELSVTRLAGAWVSQTGGAVSLRMSPSIEIAGVGRVGLRHPIVENRGSRVQARFGYAGVRLTLRPTPERPRAFSPSLLVGGGNLDVREPSTRMIVDSDNGAIVEPGVAIDLPMVRRVVAAVAFSWRLALAFDAVGGVESENLTAPALSVGVRFGPF